MQQPRWPWNWPLGQIQIRNCARCCGMKNTRISKTEIVIKTCIILYFSKEIDFGLLVWWSSFVVLRSETAVRACHIVWECGCSHAFDDNNRGPGVHLFFNFKKLPQWVTHFQLFGNAVNSFLSNGQLETTDKCICLFWDCRIFKLQQTSY